MMKSFKTQVLGILFLSLGLFAPCKASADEGPESFALSELDEQPVPISRVMPRYPLELKRARILGKITVGFIIDTSGRVTNPFIVSSNNPWFDRPTIDAIAQWKYRPGRKGGRVVNTRAEQIMYFQLGGGGGDNLWEATKGKDHKNLPLEIRWDKSPEPITSNYPIYPAEALLAKTQGRAVVGFVINREGKIQGTKLVKASAPEFGGAAIASVDAWTFKPATREGVSCSAALRMEFDFAPNGETSVPVSMGMNAIVRELGRKEPRIHPVDQLDTSPKPVSRRPPIYPSMLRELGPAGKAMIEFFIDENGDAQLPRIVSATAPEFGYAAAQAVAAWRFEIPRKGGKPVIARTQISIQFESPAETPQFKEQTLKEDLP